MILGSVYLVNVSTVTKPKIDFISIILSTIGFGGIIYGISSVSGNGDIKIIGVISIIGIISLILFGKRQLSLKEPMLDLRAFKYPLFILSHANSDTSLMKIIVLFMVADIGIGITMSPCQTSALSQLPKEFYPHGVAIINTLQQLSAAIGSSLFIGIMSASQQKALNNLVPEQAAVAAGFNTATLALAGFVLIGLCLSFALSLENKNNMKMMSEEAA